MAIESAKARIVEEAQRVENDTLYSAKGHFEAANGWKNFHIFLGIPTVICSAVAGASAFSQFDNHTTIAGILAILAAALTAVSTFLNPNELASAHQNIGNRYTALRNRARTFYTMDALIETSDQELVKQLKELIKQRDELNAGSPPIPRWAYQRARQTVLKKQLQLQQGTDVQKGTSTLRLK